MAGIDSGLPSRQWSGKPVHTEKSICQLPQKNARESCLRKLVLVPFGSGECELECFSTLRVEADITECQEQNITFFTGLEVPGISTGYAEVAPFSETNSVIDSDFVFHISAGALIVTVHESTRKMRKGEFFFVPRGVHYAVKNDSRRKAVLVFTKYN
ncbi:centromere protein C-like [Zootermopsis nevadensis]|uniref:centromere protein C-like n=1 Tax=Zootermopsis nevadensis TaxID=136037 RepID=UPI000B8E9C0C|nr:centromere protein C-like [Zootermopsis nevadensis]